MTRTRLIACFALIGAASCPGPAGAQVSPVPLDTVHVSVTSEAAADLATPTRAVSVVTAEDIRRGAARDVNEALQWVLGVDLMARSPALADVSIRGSSFEQVLVLVDGVRVSDRQTGHFDLNLTVPIEQVERIEVLRGAASGLHGSDAVGGVINVITRERGGSSVRAEYGSFGTAGLALAQSVGIGEASVDLGVDVVRSDGHRAGTDYEMILGRVALSKPLLGRLLRADLGFAARNFGADNFYAPFPSYEETRATTLTVRWQGSSRADVIVEPVVAFRKHEDDFILRRSDPSFYRNQHETEQLQGSVSVRRVLSPSIRLAAVVDAELDVLKSASLGNRSEGRGATSWEVALGRVGTATGTVGLRADVYDTHPLFLSPAVAGAWWPTRSVSLRASVGRALRTPTWTERYYTDPANVGDPDLAPERSWTSEVGVEAVPVTGIRLEGSLFRRDARNLIDWARPAAAPASVPWQTRNVADARFEGGEVAVDIRTLQGFRARLSGSWISLETGAEAGYVSKYALRPLVRVITGSVEREIIPRVTLNVKARHARRRAEDSHLRLDSRLGVDTRWGRAFLDLRNAGDAEYPDITGAPAPGRAIALGFEWRRAAGGVEGSLPASGEGGTEP